MDINKKTKIVFFGDSVTQGCFENYPMPTGFGTAVRQEDGYVFKLTRILKAAYGDMIETVNAGVGGDNTDKGLARIEKSVLAENPDIVVVCFGLNDVFGLKEKYIANLDKIFSLLWEHGIKTIFMTPNMLDTYAHDNVMPVLKNMAKNAAVIQLGGKFDDFMASAKELAINRGVAVCDVYSYWKKLYESGTDTTMLLSNYINHPTAEMHDIFVNMLLDTIKAL